jgi:L-threonylcarbamoyladenylate synthase
MAPEDIARAVAILRRGELVAFPTETVYGLGADAANPEAVRRLFAAKGRPADHPVIVHVAEVVQLADWAREIPESAGRLATAFWPGPLTLILKRAGAVSDLVTGGQDTVGVRVPSHPVARSLLRAFGGGIAAPSANRFGRISPTTAAHVHAELGDRVELVLDGGASDVGIESTIVDLSGAAPALLRPGMIGAAQIEAVLGALLATVAKGSPRASGMLAAHYAPATPLRILARDEIDRLVPAPGERVAVLARRPAHAGAAAAWLEAPADPRGYAHALYRNLRALDTAGYSRILVEALPETPEWLAVRDRLARAARGAGISAP